MRAASGGKSKRGGTRTNGGGGGGGSYHFAIKFPIIYGESARERGGEWGTGDDRRVHNRFRRKSSENIRFYKG